MPEQKGRDEFYVGYLPVPAGQLRFVRITVPLALWILVACGVAIACFQRSPGDAVWEDGKPIQRTGILRERPYPHLVSESEGALPIFLVEQGKKGSARRSKGLDGSRVRVTGFRLIRDGREIIELVPELSAIERAAGIVSIPQDGRDLGETSLEGEVVDYKCFLGAMKPGDGKTHKACAALCITGGIPPMLVTTDAKGTRQYTVLADKDGGSISDSVIELAGEPVRVTGRLHEQSSLRVLRVNTVTRVSR